MSRIVSLHDEKRFYSFVDCDGNCWYWNGGLRGPYGAFKLQGKVVDAQRVSWMIEHQKEIPEGIIVRHTCDHQRCVRPSHLILGTHQDNMDDAAERGFNKADIYRNDAPDKEEVFIILEKYKAGETMEQIKHDHHLHIGRLRRIIKRNT